MPFTTVSFVFLFLPLSIIGYYLLKIFKKDFLNDIYLILVSIAFYMYSGIVNTLYLLLFINVVYIFGKIIENNRNKKSLYFFITLFILILAYYKYAMIVYNLFIDIKSFPTTFSSLVMPLGMSFIIFESISYLIDIYRKEASKGSYLEVMLFFLFFPKITSGPIVLWRDFYKQLKNRNFSVDLFSDGIERIIIGFSKKVIIADTLGYTVSMITSEANIDTKTAYLGMFLYFLQIYYDFSGYSDIAIGVSKLFGFNLKENFNYPYTSITLAEFWRRWHISLGNWFKYYIYIPLGGNKKNIYFNLFIVFLITGIWHGSTINFVLWGIAHAIFIICERFVKDKKWYINIPKIIKWFILNIFIMFTWIIFMLPTLWQAKKYYLTLLGIYSDNIYFTFDYFFTSKLLIIILIAVAGVFLGKMKFISIVNNWTINTKLGFSIKMLFYLLLFLLSILFMTNSSYSPFLYFQF